MQLSNLALPRAYALLFQLELSAAMAAMPGAMEIDTKRLGQPCHLQERRLHAIKRVLGASFLRHVLPIGAGLSSADVIINTVSRQRDPATPITIMTPDALILRHAPIADCARYDSLRRI